MYRKLASIATELDARGLYEEADVVTHILQKVSKKSTCPECGAIMRRMKDGKIICPDCSPVGKSGKGKKSWECERRDKALEHSYASRKAGVFKDELVDMYNRGENSESDSVYDWQCPYCDAMNSADKDFCDNCGRDRDVDAEIVYDPLALDQEEM